jgi:LEA14-like dessication related protein
MRGILIILTVVCMSVLSSCKLYTDVEFKGVRSTKFGEFNREGVTCDITLEIYNPNPYKITLLDSDIELMLEGTKLGHVELPSTAVLDAEDKSLLTMTCKVPGESIPAIAGSAIGLVFKKDLMLEGKGTLRAKALLISKTFPVEFKQRITKEDLGL